MRMIKEVSHVTCVLTARCWQLRMQWGMKSVIFFFLIIFFHLIKGTSWQSAAEDIVPFPDNGETSCSVITACMHHYYTLLQCMDDDMTYVSYVRIIIMAGCHLRPLANLVTWADAVPGVPWLCCVLYGWWMHWFHTGQFMKCFGRKLIVEYRGTC